MFGTILIITVTLTQIYITFRIASIPFLKRYSSLKTLISISTLLWVTFVAGRIYGHHNTGYLASFLEFTGMNWMGILFLVFVCILTIDILTLFGFLFSRSSARLRGVALIIGVLFSVIALFQGLRPPIIQNYDVRLSGLPHEMNGTVIVAMSDLHVGSLIGEQWLAARVAQVKKQRPDMVVLLGDIFEGHENPSDNFLSMLGNISAPLGVWAVLGNHESYGRHHKQSYVSDGTHFNVLRNRWVEIKPGFILAGVDDLTVTRRFDKNIDLISTALNNRPPSSTILLSHTPWKINKAAHAGVGLMLSGHTHGGQIWPFGYLVQCFYPMLGGRYEVDGMTLIVCRGTGTWGPRIRLWRPGEILRITLYTAQN